MHNCPPLLIKFGDPLQGGGGREEGDGGGGDPDPQDLSGFRFYLVYRSSILYRLAIQMY